MNNKLFSYVRKTSEQYEQLLSPTLIFSQGPFILSHSLLTFRLHRTPVPTIINNSSQTVVFSKSIGLLNWFLLVLYKSITGIVRNGFLLQVLVAQNHQSQKRAVLKQLIVLQIQESVVLWTLLIVRGVFCGYLLFQNIVLDFNNFLLLRNSLLFEISSALIHTITESENGLEKNALLWFTELPNVQN